MGASSNRVVTAAEFPANGSVRDKLGFIAKCAMLVESHRLWQPWEFRVTDQFIELSAATGPVEGVTDPEGRKAMIHSGMALQHLKLALKRFSCFGRTELFPDLDKPALAARVFAGCGGGRDVQERELLDALEMRETGAISVKHFPVSDAVMALLGQATASERAWVEFARSESSRRRVLELVSTPGQLQVKEIHVQDSSLSRLGNEWEAGSLSSTASHGRFARWRRPFLAIKLRATPHAVAEPGTMESREMSNGDLAVLKTKTDDRHGWLAAGQALARLLLQSRLLGVSCSPHLDALQRPDSRAELRASIGHKGFAQAILHCSAARPGAVVHSEVSYPMTVSGNSS